MKVVLRRDAERDLEQVALWYDQQRAGLGSEFLGSFEARLTSIEANPEAYPLVASDVRRALLSRFPYGVFYIIEPERVVVVGCFHVRQSPRRWQKRR